jgi:hypothetical protein
MIVVGYTVWDGGWGRRYRRVTDPDQSAAIRKLTRRSHVSNADIQAFTQLNVFFHEDGTTYNDSGEEVGTFTHMRPEGEDGATQ